MTVIDKLTPERRGGLIVSHRIGSQVSRAYDPASMIKTATDHVEMWSR